MILSYQEFEEPDDETSKEYYDDLDGNNWSSSVVGDWKDLE